MSVTQVSPESRPRLTRGSPESHPRSWIPLAGGGGGRGRVVLRVALGPRQNLIIPDVESELTEAAAAEKLQRRLSKESAQKDGFSVKRVLKHTHTHTHTGKHP